MEPSAAVIADDIRIAIVRLDEQRRAAARMAGRALATRAEVQHACGEQLRLLADAAREAQRGRDLARRAAGSAAGLDLVAYESTATGLDSVRAALAVAREPLDALLTGADENAEQARAVLVRARQVFDEQVRAQLRLLAALERAERARLTRELRRG